MTKLVKEVNKYHKKLMNKVGKHKVPERLLNNWLKEFVAIDKKHKKLKPTRVGIAHKTVLEKRLELSKKYIVKVDKY